MAANQGKKRTRKGDKSLVTQATFARLIGISRQTLSKLVERGDIPLIGGKIEPITAREIIESGRLLNKNGNGDESLADARRRALIAKANLLELEYSLRKGDTLEKDAVLEANQRIIKNTQRLLRGIPVKIASLLLPLTTEAEIQELLLSEIDRALLELSNLGKKNDRKL